MPKKLAVTSDELADLASRAADVGDVAKSHTLRVSGAALGDFEPLYASHVAQVLECAMSLVELAKAIALRMAMEQAHGRGEAGQ